MIDTVDLRKEQALFEGTRQEFKKELKRLEKERKKFLRKFPKEKMMGLNLHQYIVGKKSKESFCYCLENTLQRLGNIHGSTSIKFGIYFGKTKSDSTIKYRFASRFGDNETEAFENVKKSIVQLLTFASSDNSSGIRKNQLSPMFKGKILATYYPEKFLNIYADKHLDYFLDKLEIPSGDVEDEISKRKSLIEFKNNDSIMSDWANEEFSHFLYDRFGRPPKLKETHTELKEFIESKQDYPRLKKVKAEFVDLEINPKNSEIKPREGVKSGKTVDFAKENKKNKLLGNRGEQIVFIEEKKYLVNMGRKEHAEKVDWVAKEDDSCGYDILSYEEDGSKKHIEVKSTNQSPQAITNFIISSNQYQKAKNLNNYYFYIVFNAKSETPKIWKIKDPLKFEDKGLSLTPLSFRVTINSAFHNS